MGLTAHLVLGDKVNTIIILVIMVTIYFLIYAPFRDFTNGLSRRDDDEYDD